MLGRRVSRMCLVGWVCVFGWSSIACKTTQQRVRVTKKSLPTVRPLPKRPMPPTKPAVPVDPYKQIKEQMADLGQRILKRGLYVGERQRALHQLCNKPKAPRRSCRIYRLSQRIFAYNYRTRRTNYRGYLLYHWRRKRRIPRWLRRWHRRMRGEKYKAGKGRCYIENGLATSCMGFAVCAQRVAMRRFQGPWGKVIFPTWGYINYWTNHAYISRYRDYTIAGERRYGVRTLLTRWPIMLPQERRRRARQLLLDMYASFLKLVRRKLRNRWNRMLYSKLFCTNIVSGAGNLDRAIPGDLFGVAYLRKRKRTGPIYKVSHQHWGLVVDPGIGKILHNQTPGGLWGRQFHRWGIQYGTYRRSFMLTPWRKRRRFWSKRVFFTNRLNLHYFAYAKSRRTPIYHTSHSGLCREWIKEHAPLYFANLGSRYALPPRIFERRSLGVAIRSSQMRRRLDHPVTISASLLMSSDSPATKMGAETAPQRGSQWVRRSRRTSSKSASRGWEIARLHARRSRAKERQRRSRQLMTPSLLAPQSPLLRPPNTHLVKAFVP